MAITYEKMSATEVAASEVKESISTIVYTEDMLNKAIEDIDSEIVRLGQKKTELQDVLATVIQTLSNN